MSIPRERNRHVTRHLIAGPAHCAVYLLLAACGERPVREGVPDSIVRSRVLDRAPAVELIPMESFGWPDLASATASLSETERTYSGGVIGRITGSGLAEDAHGYLYVLDQSYQKVVIFGPQGDYQRIVVGGYGGGPGEFVRPRCLAVAADGTIAVLDDANQRITLFDAAGSYLNSFVHAGSSPIWLAFQGDTLLVSLWARQAGIALIKRYDRSGTPLDTLGAANEEEAQLGSFGEAGRLVAAPGGHVGWSSPVIGVWLDVRGASVTRRGTRLFPELRGWDAEYQGQPYRYVPVTLRGAGMLPSGRRGLYIVNYGRNPPVGPDQSPEHMLAVLDEADEVAGVYRFERGVQPWGFLASISGEYVFFGFTDPYPHVRKYAVQASRSVSP